MLSQPKKRTLQILLAMLVASLGVVFIRNLIDFPVYYRAGQSLLNGRTDLYAADFALGQVMDYRYPPFFLLIFAPLWLLPYKFAAYLWYLLGVLQIYGCLLILKNLLQPSIWHRKIVLLIFCSCAQYFIIILHYGNAHLLAIFLLFAALYFALKNQGLKAAIFMALAITIKLTPGFLLLYFLLKKRWKYLALVGAFLLLLNLAPAVFFGFQKNTELLKTWTQHVVLNQEFHEFNGPINLSFKGQLLRSFTTVDYQQRVDGDTRYPQVNIASMTSTQAHRIWLLGAGLMVAGALQLIYKNQQHKKRLFNFLRREMKPTGLQEASFSNNENNGVAAIPEKQNHRESLVEIGMLISLMLFVEPLTSKIYFIALLWPLTVLATLAFEQKDAKHKWLRMVLLIVAMLNFVLPLLPGRSLQRWLLVLGVDFYLNLLLFVLQAYYLMSKRLIHSPSNGEPQRQAP